MKIRKTEKTVVTTKTTITAEAVLPFDTLVAGGKIYRALLMKLDGASPVEVLGCELEPSLYMSEDFVVLKKDGRTVATVSTEDFLE